MSIPVMEAHSGAFRSIPVRSGPFLLLYAPALYVLGEYTGEFLTCNIFKTTQNFDLKFSASIWNMIFFD